MHVSNNANCVLLQVAQAFVCRPDNQQLGWNAHVIFDSCCSQRSYITSNACEQLNLPTIGKETLLIKTFGDNSASVYICCTGNLQPTVQSTVWNHIAILPLLAGSVSVDVLIGADYYWSFFTGNIIKGDPYGPVALETNLGWVSSGPTTCSTITRSCTVN